MLLGVRTLALCDTNTGLYGSFEEVPSRSGAYMQKFPEGLKAIVQPPDGS